MYEHHFVAQNTVILYIYFLKKTLLHLLAECESHQPDDLLTIQNICSVSIPLIAVSPAQSWQHHLEQVDNGTKLLNIIQLEAPDDDDESKDEGRLTKILLLYF